MDATRLFCRRLSIPGRRQAFQARLLASVERPEEAERLLSTYPARQKATDNGQEKSFSYLKFYPYVLP
jgi:hypothetical protein